MIEWLWSVLVAFFRRPDADAAEALFKANAGMDRLAGRLESQLEKSETKLESARHSLDECLESRRHDAQELAALTDKLNRIQQRHDDDDATV
jgi:DNA repair ATPase RecN